MKKSLLFVIPLAVLLTILLISAYLLLTPNSQEVYALETEEIEPLEETATLFIDGEQDTSLVTIELGESKTFSVLYRGDYYVPTISDENGLMAVSYSNGTVTVEENCQLGELLLTLSCTFNDGTSFYDNILINVVGQSSSYVQLNQTGDGLFVDLADNVKYVDAYTTTELDDPKTVRLYDGDNLDLVLADNKHNSSGVTLNYTTAGLISDDGNGNETVQEMQNGSFGVSMASETTHSLEGNGNWLIPYKIYDEEDFHAIKNYDSQDDYIYFKQYANFTMSTTFTQFHFYGDYYAPLKSITVDGLQNEYSALFRQNHGKIRSLTVYVKSLTVSAVGYVGVLCTQNYGTITGVSVEMHSSVLPGQNGNPAIMTTPVFNYNMAALAGGFCGFNHSDAFIKNSESSLRVGASFFYGGFAYTNSGTINSPKGTVYVHGAGINNLTRIGGVAGVNNGVITLTETSYNDSGEITNAYSIEVIISFEESPTISAAPCCGGIIGQNGTSLASLGFDPDNLPEALTLIYGNTNPSTLLSQVNCNQVIGLQS